MKTKSVTIDDTTYVIAPLNFDQYESHFFNEDGSPLARPRIGAAVRDSLANAKGLTNPPYEEIPAGHVLKLAPEIAEASGLEKAEPAGEATAAATA